MFKNVLWDFLGKFSVQIVSFGISVILTRLLSPAEFGIMGMAMAVIVVAHIFLDLGFNRAIIQAKEISALQYSTIFYVNAVAAAVLTLACYLVAEPLASFYNQASIGPVFKALSVLFILNGLNLVPGALMYKRLLLKLNSIITLVSAVISGIIGVILAYSGYGVWSLVIQAILNALLVLLLTTIFIRWHPMLSFKLSSIKPLWAYGSKLFASGLLDSFYTRLDVFIIGKIFSLSTLGFYTRAQSMDNFVRQITVNSVMGALFPYIAKHQDDREYVAHLYKKYLHVISFVAIALSGTLFLTAPQIFLLLFTPKWLYAAWLFQLLSVVGFIWPVSSMMCNIIAGLGNSTAFLNLEVLKKILFLPVYVFGFLFGMRGFLYFFIAGNFVALVVNAYYVSREIRLTVRQQLSYISAYYAAGLVSAALSYLICHYAFKPGLLGGLIAPALLFNIIYLLLSYLLQLEAVTSAKSIYQKIKQAIYDKRNKNVPTTI